MLNNYYGYVAHNLLNIIKYDQNKMRVMQAIAL